MGRMDMFRALNLAIMRAGSQAKFAEAHGLSRQYVNQVVNAVKPPSPALLAAIGLRQVVGYEPLPAKAAAA